MVYQTNHAVTDPHIDHKPRTSEAFPIYTILAFVAPIAISVLSFVLGYHQGSGSFRPLIMFGFGILGTAGGAVIGIALGVAGLSRREEGSAAALLPIALSVIVLVLVACLFLLGQ